MLAKNVKQGLLMSSTLASMLREQLMTFDSDKFIKTVKNLIAQGCSPLEVANALTSALKGVGSKFESGELFLIHLVQAGEIAKRAMSEILEPLIKQSSMQRKVLGKILIGTVAGDIHDIGKNIVATMLFSAGFEVYDLGKDVSVEEFVQKTREVKPDIIAMSALLTTTLPSQRDIVRALEKAGLRNKVKILVGGAPATSEWAEKIGADGYAEDAVQAVQAAKKLLGASKREGKQF